MDKLEKNCAFQYWNGYKVVCDKYELTLEEAKSLWNEHYDDMIERVQDGENIEVVIWINMKDDLDYKEHLVWLQSPLVKDGVLYEPKYYTKFKL